MADVERSPAFSPDVDGTLRRRPPRACAIMAQEKVAMAAAAAAAATKTRSLLSPSALVRAEKIVPGETDLQRERRALRSMWELACVINFLNVFRSVVQIRAGFHADELETSLMTPNGLIKDLHIDLLKGIPPIPRVPIDKNNWAAVLCAKLRDRWSQVCDGVCPLMAAKGEEEAAYNALNASARLRILRALCEMRLDTEDVRGAMDDTIKQGEPPSSFQLQPVAVDNSGCTYWYEDDETVGSRLYKEIPTVQSKSKTRGMGRKAPPPAAPVWETIATNVEEFQDIGERLSNSRNKPEAKLGRIIFEELLPSLEERERKREKAVKKQQRQQLLLQSIMNGVGLAAGRSRRERKIVSYTFEEFDKSINEAIKWTKYDLEQLFAVNEELFTSLGVAKECFENPSEEMSAFLTSTLWTLFTERATEPIRKRQRLSPDTPRSANWEYWETLALVRAKREEAIEVIREPEGTPPKPSRERWAFVILKLQSWGVDRDVRTCVRRWENLCRYYRKVYWHENFSGKPSFWTLSFKERKDGNMPFQLERRVFDEMDEFMGLNSSMISPTRVLALCDRPASPCNADSFVDGVDAADPGSGDGDNPNLWMDVWKSGSADVAESPCTPDVGIGDGDQDSLLTPNGFTGDAPGGEESSPSPDKWNAATPSCQASRPSPYDDAANGPCRRLPFCHYRRRRWQRQRRRNCAGSLPLAINNLTKAVVGGGEAFMTAFTFSAERHAILAVEGDAVVCERRQVIRESDIALESGQHMLLSVLQRLNTTLNSMIWSISRAERMDERCS